MDTYAFIRKRVLIRDELVQKTGKRQHGNVDGNGVDKPGYFTGNIWQTGASKKCVISLGF
jgi:hypothetical protein